MIQLFRKGRGMEWYPIDRDIPSLQDLFSNIDDVLSHIPREDRVNLFYTVNDSAPSPDGHERPFVKYTTLAFDIDGIDITKRQAYAEVVRKYVGCGDENLTVIFTGHGLHFLIQLTPRHHFTDDKEFTRLKPHYRMVCTKLEQDLKANDLPGKVDTSIFDRARVLRVPGTINDKPGKGIVNCELLHLGLVPFDYSLTDSSGLELLQGGQSVQAVPANGKRKVRSTGEGDGQSIEFYGAIDEQTVRTDCAFIRDAASPEKRGSYTEPHWYAINSIVGKFKDGRRLIHEWSKDHPSYDKHQVDQKIDQALEKSGPRTCASIDGIWDGCRKCPHFGKIKSPITLRGPDFIATEESGFHKLSINGLGVPKLTPAYDDLLKRFKKDHVFKTIDAGRVVRVWQGTHYKEMADATIEGYAQKKFNPFASTTMTKEFMNLVQREELVGPDWFKDTTEGKLNLKNGVYDVRANRFLPHDPKFGFIYQLDFDWDPLAKCPLFDKFLDEIMCGDKELTQALMEFMAYALSGEKCSNDKILFLYGTGSNGKTRFLRILRALFGKSLVNFQPRELLQQFDRLRLDGALAVLFEETPSGKDKPLWEMIKHMASGGTISVANKFKPIYEIENRAKMIFTANELPGGTDANHGYFRRFLMIPFNAQFEGDNKDPLIAEKIIAAELPGILNKVLEVLKELRRNSFEIHEPGTSTALMKEYVLERDTISAWNFECLRHISPSEVPMAGKGGPLVPAGSNQIDGLTDDQSVFCIDKDGLPYITRDALYSWYRHWCRESGISIQAIISKQLFFRKLLHQYKGMEIKEAFRGHGVNQRRVIVGLVPKWVPIV